MSQNPFTLEAFARFVSKQNPDEGYDYADSEMCACAQYARSIGLYSDWAHRFAERGTFWYYINDIAGDFSGRHSGRRPYTWGRLLDRLVAAMGR